MVRIGARARLLALLLAAPLVWTGPAAADDVERIAVGFLGMERDEDREPVSVVDPVLDDEGVQGARLGVRDNNATAQFLGQEFELEEVVVPYGGDAAEGLRELAEKEADWIVSDLPRDALLDVLDQPEAEARIIFNTRAPEDVLRNEACADNLFHAIPSRRMRADALAQFLNFKRWQRWALVYGSTEEDERLANAFRAAAERFGASVVGEKAWPHSPMARRAEGGFHAIQREIPVFVQDLPEHDVLIVVDETDYFGEYFPYQTRLPRPVAGTQGLIPTSWHRAHESWGAVQLQRRFESLAERSMTPRDFAAWIAVRSIGEAAARTQSVAQEDILDYMLSENFELAAYLGYPVTYRTWNHQLRQPILVTGPRMVASVSPQEGFLHPRTPLDSLGYDEPESGCRFE